jgi:hypothetical protein
VVRQVDAAVVAEQRLARGLAQIDFASVFAAAAERAPAEPRPDANGHVGCPICRGHFGPVVDSTELMKGVTFLTANQVVGDELELVQVSSTRHRDDLDSVPPMDAIAIFDALVKTEEYLLASGDPRFPESGPKRRGWVVVSKRRRAHGHGRQSIWLRASEPLAVARERELVAKNGGGTPSLLETRNPAELLIGEFRGGLAAAVPREPRCAFETVIHCRPSATGCLSDLNGNQRWGLAQAIREITGALRLELSVRGLPERYGWQVVAAVGIEPYVRIVTPRTTVVSDAPREWVEKLREHIGVE